MLPFVPAFIHAQFQVPKCRNYSGIRGVMFIVQSTVKVIRLFFFILNDVKVIRLVLFQVLSVVVDSTSQKQ